jgi:multidrug resistance efflux pump
MHSHEVHDVRAELTKAQAELDRRRSELQFARKARDRTARLNQLKAASLEQLQRAEADLTVAEQAVISAQAEIERITEHLRYLGFAAEDHLEAEQRARPAAPGTHEPSERVPVVAPLAGVVLKRMVTPWGRLDIDAETVENWTHPGHRRKYIKSSAIHCPN